MKQKQILVVGVDVVTDTDLQGRIAQMNPAWSSSFACSGNEALEVISTAPFDAVIADVRLPDMDGIRFLNTVKKRCPEAHRLVVSDLGDRGSAVECAGVAHHCVPKPWDAEALRTNLERTFSLGIWLSNQTVRVLAGRMTVVPSPPELYFEIVRALQSPQLNLEELAGHIARDPAITSKLLQLSNSAVLGLHMKVTTVQDAIGYLGLDMTRSLILLAHSFSDCDKARTSGFSVDQLWQHSLRTGLLAHRIATLDNASSDIVDESFLAGLLHDLGKLLLAVNLPEDYKQVIANARERKVSLWEAELEKFGATHGEVGAELLATWNLPLTVVEAVALHHYPAKMITDTFSPLTAVHAANVFEHERSHNPSEHVTVDRIYLADLGLADRLESWRAACA